jgi:hypothetical protein
MTWSPHAVMAGPPDRAGLDGTGKPAVVSSSPKLDAGITGRLRARLAQAFAVATQRVREVDGCAALFGSLQRDGLELLRSTRYALAQPGVSTDTCSRPEVPAFTAVGSPATWVCPLFERLPNDAAAVTLLHEALHYAGLRESPTYPNSLKPAEINLMVRRGCRF